MTRPRDTATPALPGLGAPPLKPWQGGQREPHVLARRDDPATSKAAARATAPALGVLRRAALEAIAAHPGSTACELADALGHRDPRTLGRRIYELAQDGLIVSAATRRCTITGRQAQTWRVQP